MTKILVINVNWLGDVLFSVPVIKAIRKQNPSVHIACLVLPRCAAVLANNPVIDEIIIYDEAGKHRSLLAKIKFINFLRRKHFDVSYILHPSLKRALISYLAGVPIRIGYDTKKRRFLLTQAIPLSTENLHKIDHFLRLLPNNANETYDRRYEFFPATEDFKTAGSLLQQAGMNRDEKFIVLNPGGNWQLKRWPLEYFAQLADLLTQRLKLKVVIVGAQKDKDLVDKIRSQMKYEAINLAGQTNLSVLGAVMQKSSCVVSADSGPMHIAAAVGANTVAIFGPTAVNRTGPSGMGKVRILQKNVGCEVPCYVLDCRDNRCMKAVCPEEVFEAISDFVR